MINVKTASSFKLFKIKALISIRYQLHHSVLYNKKNIYDSLSISLPLACFQNSWNPTFKKSLCLGNVYIPFRSLRSSAKSPCCQCVRPVYALHPIFWNPRKVAFSLTQRQFQMCQKVNTKSNELLHNI